MNKKNQKNFIHSLPLAYLPLHLGALGTKVGKVFCFFFSKKKFFLTDLSASLPLLLALAKDEVWHEFFG